MFSKVYFGFDGYCLLCRTAVTITPTMGFEQGKEALPRLRNPDLDYE
jgi:hypothetical protein